MSLSLEDDIKKLNGLHMHPPPIPSRPILVLVCPTPCIFFPPRPLVVPPFAELNIPLDANRLSLAVCVCSRGKV